jgi:hypothetical protein
LQYFASLLLIQKVACKTFPLLWAFYTHEYNANTGTGCAHSAS